MASRRASIVDVNYPLASCAGTIAYMTGAISRAPAHAFDKLVTKWWLWLPIERIRIIAGALHDAQF